MPQTHTQNKDSTESLKKNTQNQLKAKSGAESPSEENKEDLSRPNKGGRPKGAKNTLTLIQEAAKEGVMTEVLNRFDKVVDTTIRLAEEGDSTCLKILWDRVIPAQKATDGKDTPTSGGVTIVVQGTTSIRPTEEITDAQIVSEETSEIIEGDTSDN